MVKNPLPNELLTQWHPTKNLPLTPNEVNAGSARKVWWIGQECRHTWFQEVRAKDLENNCLVCSGRHIEVGVNDLASLKPELTAEWHPTKNLPLLPTEVTLQSNRKVWWIGQECGHEWEAAISKRTNGSGCPVCKGKRVVVGFNDFSSAHPQLVQQWHPTKNILTPTEVTSGSHKAVWWVCEKNHEWEATVKHRALLGRNCPYCSGNQVAIGFNDLTTTQPELVKEWHTKNVSTPETFTYGSDAKVWWVCNKGHEWEARIANRSSKDANCPECAATNFVSKAEHDIAIFLSSAGLTMIQSDRKLLKGMELDIYIPAKYFAIDYNVLYWHTENQGKDRTYHYDKWLAAKNAGIQLVQIWEDEWNKNPSQIKAMLLHKLGITQQEKVFARKTFITQLKKAEIEAFLEQHHVQGYAAGSHYLGLREKSTYELVSVLVLKKEANNTLNIIRYATSKNVVGGFTKLLKYAELTYKPTRFITFSDHCVSDGGLYENNGFTADKELAPDYRYVVNGERQHKFGYRLKRFRNDPNLKYEDGLTERELAALNGLPRIWDAGKTRWVKAV